MKGEYVPDDEITIGMSVAGGRLLETHLADSLFMVKPNACGELSARVYRAMCQERVAASERATLRADRAGT